MANETIELLKGYEPGKMPWPAGFQEKFDGVPVRFLRIGNKVTAVTRQGEPVNSVGHLADFTRGILLQPGGSFTGEMHIPGMAFKDISGLVRKNAPAPELMCRVFDADIWASPELDWWTRYKQFTLALEIVTLANGMAPEDAKLRTIPTVTVASAEEADAAFSALMEAKPDAEGAVLHSLAKSFQPGKRCWGTQRIKPVPTIDLLVVGYDEAISQEGAPLGMVGRINAEFSQYVNGLVLTTVIGIGPGAMTHAVRKAEWTLWKMNRFKPRIAEIKYMRDETYEALRQPTWKHWRDDKAKPDVVIRNGKPLSNA